MQEVVDTIKIEKLEGGSFNVIQGDRYTEELGFDEMLGLIAALTVVPNQGCLDLLKTKEQHEVSLVKLDGCPSEVEFEDILVPNSVCIFYLPNGASEGYGDGLFIAFNEQKQLLGFYDTTYCVQPIKKCYIGKAQCKLVSCKREDLKPGDTAFCDLLDNFLDSYSYCKVIDEDKVACIDQAYNREYGGVMFQNWDEPDYRWYKVIPL